MDKIRKIVKELLTKNKNKNKCSCGCNSCKNVGNPGPVLNENINAKVIMTENMKHHVTNKLPISENLFRYGSQAFLDLWAETRYLYSRNAIHVNEIDKEILLETDLGEYGIYNGQKVPLDLLLEDSLGDISDIDFAKHVRYIPLSDLLWKIMNLYHDRNDQTYLELYYELEPLFSQDSKNKTNYHEVKTILSKYLTDPEINELLASINTGLNEAKDKKHPPLNKPHRGGAKKFYVYVRNPKTKSIKKVSFGDTTGLSAKINNPTARRAFAKRHHCERAKDKTKASYWSCRLPRYAKLLGLKSNFSGYW